MSSTGPAVERPGPLLGLDGLGTSVKTWGNQGYRRGLGAPLPTAVRRPGLPCQAIALLDVHEPTVFHVAVVCPAKRSYHQEEAVPAGS